MLPFAGWHRLTLVAVLPLFGGDGGDGRDDELQASVLENLRTIDHVVVSRALSVGSIVGESRRYVGGADIRPFFTLSRSMPYSFYVSP